MFRKSLLTLVIALTLVVGVSKAHAYSLEDAMADIASLKTQITELKDQLSAAVISTKASSSIATPVVTDTLVETQKSLTFSTAGNILPNTKSDDVKMVQDALKKLGAFKFESTGFYGAKTEMAVKAFQKAHNLPVTGVVGSLTKSLLVEKTNSSNQQKGLLPPSQPPTTSNCNPSITTPFIRVISPNGGEVYTAGQQIPVKWMTCNVPTNALIRLNLVVAPFPVPGNGNMTGVGLTQTINDGFEQVTLPTVSVFNGSQILTYGNNFKVFAWVLNSPNAQDLSDNLFTINSSSASTCNLTISPLALPSAILVNGINQDLYKFTFSNSSSTNSCLVTNMTFSINRNPSTINISNVRLIDQNGQVAGTFTYNPYSNGTPMSLFQFVPTTGSGIEITPLGSKTFSVKALVTNVPSTAPAFISTMFDQPNGLGAGVTVLDAPSGMPITNTMIPQYVSNIVNNF